MSDLLGTPGARVLLNDTTPPSDGAFVVVDALTSDVFLAVPSDGAEAGNVIVTNDVLMNASSGSANVRTSGSVRLDLESAQAVRVGNGFDYYEFTVDPAEGEVVARANIRAAVSGRQVRLVGAPEEPTEPLVVIREDTGGAIPQSQPLTEHT